MAKHVDTSKIKEWRSIITLIVFVLTNITVLFPFHIPFYIPRPIWHTILDTLSAWRIIPPRRNRDIQDDSSGKNKYWIRFRFPMNFVTAPLIADLFLLAILAIGRKEVHDGTIGENNISPIDIMAFFLTLAYIAISIDASGLIRYLAFKVLQKGGKVGHRLFLYLYVFFFGLGSFIGNDPIILSGTAFLAYMTRVSSNIVHPRAWIFTQFAVANIASAIMVSSNPTNLVLVGAFEVKFIEYTANMIIPVLATAIVLFPILLYIIFADEALIPYSIKMHELTEEEAKKKPVNPNIPNARGDETAHEKESANNEKSNLLSLEEIMNPFLDKGGAAFGAIIMTATLITLLVVNATSPGTGEHPVFWVTLPAAFVMFCWDVGFGWVHRHETREIAQSGRRAVERARVEKALRREEEDAKLAEAHVMSMTGASNGNNNTEAEDEITPADDSPSMKPSNSGSPQPSAPTPSPTPGSLVPTLVAKDDEKNGQLYASPTSSLDEEERAFSEKIDRSVALQYQNRQPTLVSLVADMYRWLQETFPTVTAVVGHLPFALVPFAFSMFVLVQALVTKGWVPVFAYGWDHWVNKTGTVGAIAGMGFLSVILCNFAGTNIGTTILLSRVIQQWEQIHRFNGTPITERAFWGTVYSMALGVNYGAFSMAFSAALAGLLWRDILARKHIHVRRLDFARVNLPIIAISMAVGCAVLIGEIYIFRSEDPYDLNRE